MNNSDVIRLIAESMNEGWEDLGIQDPGMSDDGRLSDDVPGIAWFINFSSKNFRTREEAIEYAKHCFNVDLSDEQQHAARLKDCSILLQLEQNPNL